MFKAHTNRRTWEESVPYAVIVKTTVSRAPTCCMVANHHIEHFEPAHLLIHTTFYAKDEKMGDVVVMI
jgi:hypothetical protein